MASFNLHLNRNVVLVSDLVNVQHHFLPGSSAAPSHRVKRYDVGPSVHLVFRNKICVCRLFTEKWQSMSGWCSPSDQAA